MHRTMRGLVDRVVYPRIMPLCFAFNHRVTSKWDRLFSRNVEYVRAMKPSDIGIEPACCEPFPERDGLSCPVRELCTCCAKQSSSPPHLFRHASHLLSQIPTLTVPSDMVAVLLDAVRDALVEAGARANDPSLSGTMDAETMFPILVHLCAHATWKQPNKYLAFVSEFGIGKRQQGGEADYYVTALAAAVAWICRRTPAAIMRNETRAVLRPSSATQFALVSDDEGVDDSSDDDYVSYVDVVVVADSVVCCSLCVVWCCCCSGDVGPRLTCRLRVLTFSHTDCSLRLV